MINLLPFQISGQLIIFFTKHDDKVSTSFIEENERYKRLKTANWIFIIYLMTSSRPFTHGQISWLLTLQVTLYVQFEIAFGCVHPPRFRNTKDVFLTSMVS